MELVAAEKSFRFAETYFIGLLFCGIAVLAAIGALSHQHERAFSASLIYLGLGVGSALVIEALGVGWLSPTADAELLQRVSELAIVIALFGTGLKLDRPLTWRSWSGVGRLLVVAMPLTIAAVALFGAASWDSRWAPRWCWGPSWRPPIRCWRATSGRAAGDEDERGRTSRSPARPGSTTVSRSRFSSSGCSSRRKAGAIGSVPGCWPTSSAVVMGLALGAVGGYGLGAAAVELRKRELLAPQFDPWMAIPAVLLVYGAAEIAGAYGFLAAFAGGVGFRHYEHGHEYNRRVRTEPRRWRSSASWR